MRDGQQLDVCGCESAALEELSAVLKQLRLHQDVRSNLRSLEDEGGVFKLCQHVRSLNDDPESHLSL